MHFLHPMHMPMNYSLDEYCFRGLNSDDLTEKWINKRFFLWNRGGEDINVSYLKLEWLGAFAD